MKGLTAALAAVSLFGVIASAHAQDSYGLHEKSIERINAASSIAPLSVDSFGEQLSLFNGTVEFANVDISIPGNDALPVQLARRFSIEDRGQVQPLGMGYLGGFGEWDIDVPYLKGTFDAAKGWTVENAAGASTTARCSNTTPPPGTLAFPAHSYWNGYLFHRPGQGDTSLLAANPDVPAPTGGAHPWATKDFWRFKCKSSTKNGYGGEAFIAVSPDGTEYTLDWVVSRNAPSIHAGYTYNTFDSLARKNVFFLATRIEDRFGNWVDLGYSGEKLVSITSSDGRWINLTYNGANVVSASSSVGTWSYSYLNGRLNTVTRPDQSTWTYTASGQLRLLRQDPLTYSDNVADCPPLSWGDGGGAFTYYVKQPSGATAQYDFSAHRHFRRNVPKHCEKPRPDYEYLLVPIFRDTYSLDRKVVSGPGLSPATWTYTYEMGTGFLAFREGPCSINPDGAFCSRTVKTQTVQGPDSIEKYDFGVLYEVNEGQLLRHEIQRTDGTTLRVTTNSYVTNEEVASQPFENYVGSTLLFLGDQFSAAALRPLRQRVITQDGKDFSQVTNTFDAFARPLKETRSNSFGWSRTDTTAYHDDLALWVLGQVERTTTTGLTVNGATVSGAVEIDKTVFGWNALPWKTYKFGKLQSVLSYNTTDGTLKSVSDGRDGVGGAETTITLSSWKRGIPQSIKYPATPESPTGAVETALVNDDGTIANVVDENGAKTCYAYDAMGRLSGITYPSETQVGVCDTSKWAATNQTFSWVTSAEYGIPAGHWRQLVTTGNARKFNYYDALWRPLVTLEYDAADMTGTQRFTRRAFDIDGHETFASYPGSTDALTLGTRTYYDAIDRVTKVTQDSEFADPLVTTTTYLNNANGPYTLVTNPRGQQVRTWYQMFDQPDYSKPVTIWHPEGAYTHISRDSLGKPTQLRRSNSSNPTGGTVAVNRSYVYDGFQQLCQAIEPETGSSFMGYDGSGNLAWSAAGYTTAAAGCMASTSVAARRVDRVYDNRNRLTSLAFPNGQGDQSWSYTPDGLPATVTTVNGGGNTVTNTYSYNRRRLMTQETMARNATTPWYVDYTYDANGNLSLLGYPSALSVDYAPNALGQPTKASTYATGVKYFPNGAIKQFTYGNGIVHTLTQNARGLPDTSKDAYSTTSFLNDGYDYDANGNVAAITDGATGTGQRGNRTMTYDGLDRLKTVASPMFGATGANYTYDVLDNLARVNVGGVAARDHYYCYDTAWRLTNVKTGSCAGTSVIGLGYDPQGNLNNKNGVAYTFDYGNRLRVVSGQESYLYDAYGRRVQANKSGGSYIVSQYSQSGQLLYQQDYRKAQREEYVYLGGSLVANLETPHAAGSATVVKYQHTDALGSPVVVTDANRVVLERNEYEPYGKVIAPTSPQDGPGYTGHVFDAATGMNYMQQRYYDPGIGRFLSVDPVTANSGTGANFNRYWYANNSPYRFTDPDGRRACPTGTRICYEARSTKQGPSQPALSDQQKQKDSQVAQAQRSGKLSDGTRINTSKEEQSFTASPSGTKAGIDETHKCMVCDGKQTHVMSFSLPKGDSPGHTHGEGIEQIPGRDDASRTARTGQTAYVITKSAAFGVEHTPDGYRVRFISGNRPGPSEERDIESRIEKWNSFQGTGGSQCSQGC